MSVSLIIVLLLIIAYRAGARRGLVQTIVNVVGYVAVAFAAGYLAHEYGPYFAEKMPQIANEGNGFLAVAGINLNSSFYNRFRNRFSYDFWFNRNFCENTGRFIG